MAEAKRVLIIKPSSMGDVVHALPVLGALRRAWPGAHIAWVVSRGCAGVIEGHPQLDEVIVFEREAWGWGRVWGASVGLVRLIRRLRAGRYDVALDLQGLLRTGLMTRLSGAKLRMGFANARELAWLGYNRRVEVPTAEMHAVERYMLFVRELGIETMGGPEFVLPEREEDEGWAEQQKKQFTAKTQRAQRTAKPGANDNNSQEAASDTERAQERRPLVVMNPSARWASKRWSAAGFAELADGLVRGRGAVVVFTGSEADRAVVEQVRGMMRERSVDLSGKTSIGQLVALLRRAKLWVGNDSGPMHLAAAVGTRVLAFFGPTNPVRTGPYGEAGRCVVLRTKEECAPCYRRECRRRHCMEGIDAGEAMREAERMLNRSM